jgi:hypothetical protein
MMTTGHPESMSGRAEGRLDTSMRQQSRFEYRFAMSGSNPVIPFGERHVKLYYMLLIGAIAGMTLVHAIVLFKIEAGVRSGDATTTVASRSRRAYW